MKIEDQVCSLDQAVKLRSLGLTLKSLYSWMPTTTGWGIFKTLDFASLVRENIEFFPAYTVAELVAMIVPIARSYNAGCTLFYSDMKKTVISTRGLSGKFLKIYVKPVAPKLPDGCLGTI